MKLTSNTDLYEYLLALATRLEGTGEEMVERIRFAAAHYPTIPATEFLGESMLALKLVAKNPAFPGAEKADLERVVAQLEFALLGGR